MIFFLLIFLSAGWIVKGWHAYLSNTSHLTGKNCKMFYDQTNKTTSSFISENNKNKLWPGLFSSLNNEEPTFLFGFEKAIEAVWRHQVKVNLNYFRCLSFLKSYHILYNV